jgi:hypothetical protein
MTFGACMVKFMDERQRVHFKVMKPCALAFTSIQSCCLGDITTSQAKSHSYDAIMK